MRGVENARQGQWNGQCGERMVVAQAARWSEGETVTSGGCGSGFRKGYVCVVVLTAMRSSRVQARKEGGRIKMRWGLALNRGNVETCGCNVETVTPHPERVYSTCNCRGV